MTGPLIYGLKTQWLPLRWWPTSVKTNDKLWVIRGGASCSKALDVNGVKQLATSSKESCSHNCAALYVAYLA